MLTLAVLGVSSSALWIRWCESGPFAVAFWRLVLATFFVGMACLRTQASRTAVERLLGRPAVALAGLFLAAHFITWIASLDEISVSASCFLLSVQVPFSGLVSWLAFREAPGRRGLFGMALTLVGIGLLAADDGLGLSEGSLLGTMLALSAGILVVLYMAVGRRLRETEDNLPYITAVYAWTTLWLLLAAVLLDEPKLPEIVGKWDVWYLLLLALLPTLLGHGLFNYALSRVGVHVVSLCVMAEPVAASLLAWAFLSEQPAQVLWFAGPLILVGALLATVERRD